MGTFSITIGPWLAVLLILAVLATVLVRMPPRGFPGSTGRHAAVVDWCWILAFVPAAPMIYWGDPAREGCGRGPGPGRDGPH